MDYRHRGGAHMVADFIIRICVIMIERYRLFRFLVLLNIMGLTITFSQLSTCFLLGCVREIGTMIQSWWISIR